MGGKNNLLLFSHSEIVKKSKSISINTTRLHLQHTAIYQNHPSRTLIKIDASHTVDTSLVNASQMRISITNQTSHDDALVESLRRQTKLLVVTAALRIIYTGRVLSRSCHRGACHATLSKAIS